MSWIKNPPNPKGEDGKRDVAQRHFGAFGFPAPYGHKPVEAKSIAFNMDIVGGAVGSLCEAWHAATIFGDSGHRVNLLFDRETHAISIKSAYPDGMVRIEMRKAGPLVVRLSSWVSEREVMVEGADFEKRFGTNLLRVANLSSGSQWWSVCRCVIPRSISITILIALGCG